MFRNAQAFSWGILFPETIRFYDGEYPGNIKTKIDITVSPLPHCFGNKSPFENGVGVGEKQLEHVAAGFNVEANGE